MPTNEREQINQMPDNELVAYWNVLQMSTVTIKVDPENKTQRHMIIVDELLTERGIPHESNKLIATK